MQLEYIVKYSDRKTLNITVERDRSIVVRAPKSLSSERIKEMVYEKRQWIKEKMNHIQKYPLNYSPKEFVSGETLLYLGKNYQLLIKEEDFDGVEFNQRFMISKCHQQESNRLFTVWYKIKAQEKLVPLAKKYAKNLGVEFNECKVSEMKYRWASCTPKNNIIFNWRIIKAPMYVVEYLVAHELVHLIENNHTQRFWHILSIQIPNYEKAKNWLKLNGYLLEVDF
ncbi:M48 family metallopeptidase [Hyunsoonleella sp. SJ7]|uniref:M48 family metallopeptidase n=1 Tax=Hyunsoonleella aquatilis TaxID=2762758 RepID=A0A923HG85_9FLAO|nr:SprT family zinc-dependent metalloprotease [Hyunsoonleella aquatilis]MBC3759703.1 M48 family metallopeptidase [Hyunsoonleella aquatilis]